jgi:hypothetical protein
MSYRKMEVYLHTLLNFTVRWRWFVTLHSGKISPLCVIGYNAMYVIKRTHHQEVTMYKGDTKKWELWKNPTKIEEMCP